MGRGTTGNAAQPHEVTDPRFVQVNAPTALEIPQLPKLRVRVRFSSPAPHEAPRGSTSRRRRPASFTLAALVPTYMWTGLVACRAPGLRGPQSQTMPPAGDRPAPGWRGQHSRLPVRRGVGCSPILSTVAPGRAEQTRPRAVKVVRTVRRRFIPRRQPPPKALGSVPLPLERCAVQESRTPCASKYSKPPSKDPLHPWP